MATKNKKPGPRFKVSEHVGSFFVVLVHGGGVAHGPVKLKGTATRICNALNSAYRAETFVSKSPGRRARTKGHSFERLVADAFKIIFPDAKRHLEFQTDEAAHGVDLENTGEFKVQCKKYKTYSPISKINEVQFEPMLGEIPVLVTAGDNEPPMAVLPFYDFLSIVGKSKNR